MTMKKRFAWLYVLPWLVCGAWCGSSESELDALLEELDSAPDDVKSSGVSESLAIKEDGTLQEPPRIVVIPEAVGGVPRKYLGTERKGAPVWNIKIDEIVLSGDRVSITGSFVVTNIPPMRQVTLLPGGLRRSLSLAVLTSAVVENPFRLVANDEFIVATSLPVDQQFVRSNLLLARLSKKREKTPALPEFSLFSVSFASVFPLHQSSPSSIVLPSIFGGGCGGRRRPSCERTSATSFLGSP